MSSSHPLRLLMEVARDHLRADGLDASLPDAADALGRGRRRVAREVEATNVQTDTLREALATWRAAGHTELVVKVTADGFEIGPRTWVAEHLLVDVHHGAVTDGRPTPPLVLDPGRSLTGRALLAAHLLHRDLAALREDLGAVETLLVRVGWVGPLLTRHLVMEIVGRSTTDGADGGQWANCTVADLDQLHGAALEVVPDVPVSEPVAGHRVLDAPDGAWLLFVGGLEDAPGCWPRIQAAVPALERRARDLEAALRP